MPFSNCFSQNFSFLPYSAYWASISCQFKLFSVKTKGCLSAASGKHGSKLTLEHIAVFLIEFVHTTGAIHDLLFTSVERVALGANFNVEFGFAHGRFSDKFVAARAGNIDFVVVGMNLRFHDFSFKKRV
jgi:galactoside O-acetyltransferase